MSSPTLTKCFEKLQAAIQKNSPADSPYIQRIKNAFLPYKSTIAFLTTAWNAGQTIPQIIHGYIYGKWVYFYISIGTGEHWLSKTYFKLEAVYLFLESLFLTSFAILKQAVQFIMSLPFVKKAYEATVSFFNRIPLSPEGSAFFQQVKRRFVVPPAERNPRFADTYHGKAMPLNEISKLVTINREVTIENLEHIIPYTRARDLILKNPDHIALLDCPCRMARENPCLPLDVCLIVGEPFCSFILEHHPDKGRRITAEKALQVLRETDERGNVHHAFFKDAMANRFYAICNCCSCCCGAMQAQRNGTEMLCASGYRAQVDTELCVGCGNCATYCQFSALDIIGEKKEKQISISDKCMGCGVCVSKCPTEALTLVRDASNGVPLEIDKLMQEAAGQKKTA